MKGPPTSKPACSRSNAVGSWPMRAANASSRHNKNALPCNSLLPLLVTMLTAPLPVSPVETSNVDRLIWNSLIESAERLSAREPACSSLTSDSIKEFQISRSTFDVSTGLTGSGAVNIVTKSGSNELHGSAFLLWRDDAFAARIGQEPTAFDRE